MFHLSGLNSDFAEKDLRPMEQILVSGSIEIMRAKPIEANSKCQRAFFINENTFWCPVGFFLHLLSRSMVTGAWSDTPRLCCRWMFGREHLRLAASLSSQWSIRHPRSSARACPRLDHQVYGPSRSPASSRTGSCHPRCKRLANQARSWGRNPLVFWLLFQW